MNADIGILAGEIWNFLLENGESDIVHVKLSLKITNTMVFLALGWLSREEKVEIRRDKHTLFVRLKKK